MVEQVKSFFFPTFFFPTFFVFIYFVLDKLMLLLFVVASLALYRHRLAQAKQRDTPESESR